LTPFFLTTESRNLEETLGNAFFAQEQEEAKSREIENLIKSYSGASALLPTRQYGKPINPENFGITLRSIIEKNNPYLASFLGISIGYHRRKEEDELSRKEAIERMRQKTMTRNLNKIQNPIDND
tara:strand:+ start:413 stop:787 length:375 start_codon:yes stop_codon:yes gene_type:complete